MKKLLCRLFLCGALLCAHGACAATSPDMFAYGLHLETAGGEPFFEVELPLDVYQGVTRKDLGDIRVFNGAGQVVPHALRKPAAAKSSRKKDLVRNLPYFPITAAAGGNAGDLTLHVERNGDGTIIDVRSADQGKAAGPAATVSYLIDCGPRQQPVDGLVLSWVDTDTDFLGKITVEGSDDLLTWRRLTTATIARLAFQGHRLQQNTINFPAQTQRYLRLTWPPDQEVIGLSGVTALTESSYTVDAPSRQWFTAQGVPLADAAAHYLFDLKGFMPVDRVRIRPGVQNFLASGKLSSGDTSDSLKQQQWQSLLYQLHVKGQTLNTPEMIVHLQSHRFWLLDLAENDKDLPNGAVALNMEFGWLPDHLVFLAQGAGPFQLAYGSAAMEPADFQLEALLTTRELSGGGRVTPVIIAPGPSYALGGEGRRHPARALPWKKYALWATLIGGVLMVGWMSVLLYRQLHAAPPKPDAE
ncbi:MAG: DUF3999 domain-containing protein [Deltaproteobacteria bacterium]|nr:DUF3999 domain-containing protein [Deltaproteobacteria bacterium]